MNSPVDFLSPYGMPGGMSEVTEFVDKFNCCDFTVPTFVSKDCTFCRFFLNGVYLDRVYVSDATVIRQLHRKRSRR